MSNFGNRPALLLVGMLLLGFFAQFQYAWAEGEDPNAAKPKLLWGYVDTKGKYLVKPRFESASTHYDGLAMIEVGGKIGFMDTKGKIVIKPQFESGADFLGGRAQVKTGGKWGFIDKAGKFVVPPTSKEFSYPCPEVPPDFINGLKRTQGKDKKYGFQNKKGEFVIPAIYENVGLFGEGLAPVAVVAGNKEKNGKAGTLKKRIRRSH